MNFQDFYAGDSFSAHSFLGSHPLQEGFVFRVYAPAAAKAALIGDFSDWQGKSERGVNRDAVKFMQRMNAGLKQLYPDVMLIAEDSSSYTGTTKPVAV